MVLVADIIQRSHYRWRCAAAWQLTTWQRNLKTMHPPSYYQLNFRAEESEENIVLHRLTISSVFDQRRDDSDAAPRFEEASCPPVSVMNALRIGRCILTWSLFRASTRYIPPAPRDWSWLIQRCSHLNAFDHKRSKAVSHPRGFWSRVPPCLFFVFPSSPSTHRTGQPALTYIDGTLC